jgi:two-component system OmpR family response regulator
MKKNLKSIMLVEDEVDIQEVVRLSLKSFGDFNVHICSSGPEAIEKAVIVMPDLIILDMMMPVMDGMATLRLLRMNPQLNKIPVIFMTAKAQTNEMKHYIECGAIGTISKPFDPVKLVEKINQMWDEHHE